MRSEVEIQQILEHVIPIINLARYKRWYHQSARFRDLAIGLLLARGDANSYAEGRQLLASSQIMNLISKEAG